MSHTILRQGVRSKGARTIGEYPGYAVDLDVAALTGLADNDPIVELSDRSGNARHGTQEDATKRALYKTNVLNGKPGALFDNVDDTYSLGTLSSVFATAGTCYVVATVNDTNYAIVDGSSNGGLWRFSGDGHGYMGLWRVTRLTGYPASPFMPSTGSHVLSVRSDASSYEMFKTGTSAGVQAADHSGGDAVYGISGTTKNFGGHIFRVLLYSAFHSDSERLAVENLLRGIYAL